MVAHPGGAKTPTAPLPARPRNVMNCRRLMAQTTSASNDSWDFIVSQCAPAVRSVRCEALRGDRFLASLFAMVVSGAPRVHRTLVLLHGWPLPFRACRRRFHSDRTEARCLSRVSG